MTFSFLFIFKLYLKILEKATKKDKFCPQIKIFYFLGLRNLFIKEG